MASRIAAKIDRLEQRSMRRVGQHHIYTVHIYIYGAYTDLLAGKSPNIPNAMVKYGVYIYGSGQP
jgi:hypothetical protein